MAATTCAGVQKHVQAATHWCIRYCIIEFVLHSIPCSHLAVARGCWLTLYPFWVWSQSSVGGLLRSVLDSPLTITRCMHPTPQYLLSNARNNWGAILYHRYNNSEPPSPSPFVTSGLFSEYETGDQTIMPIFDSNQKDVWVYVLLR